VPPGVEIGFTLNQTVVRATTDEAKAVAEEIEAEQNRVFLDPVLTGTYPVGAVRASLLPPIAAGVDLRGYFCWSFLDNFEWPRDTRSALAWSMSTTGRSSAFRRRAPPITPP